MNTLSSQMATAYVAHRFQADGLLERYRIVPPKHDIDDFQFRVQQKFLEGVHEAFQSDILSALNKKLGTQQKIAEVLGLKDRSSISQMKRSRTMDGIRVTASLHQF